MSAVITSRIRYRGAIASLFDGRREWNRQVEAPSWRTVGLYWHAQHRPKHFTPEGAREYGYLPRSGERRVRGSKAFRRSYTGRKLREKGHTNPLEWSGELKRATRYANVRETSKGVKIALSQARKANWRHPKSQINMADELRIVSAREVRELTREKAKAMIARLRRVQAERIVTISQA